MLLGIFGLAAEVGVGMAVLPLVLPNAAAGAPPPHPPLNNFRYRGRAVEISEAGPLLMVMVDRRMVHIERSPTRTYHSHLLPFRDFTDLRVLLRILIDMAADRLVIL